MNLKNYLKCQWDRAGAVGCFVAGAAFLAVGYLGVSGTREVADQIPYVVSGGMVGLLLFAAGVMLWLSADMRDEWRKLDAIERQLRANGPVEGAERAATAADDVRPAAVGGRVMPAQEIALR